jgi:acetylornithine/succinyldiaminopimelate/putrescine aminotransferase
MCTFTLSIDDTHLKSYEDRKMPMLVEANNVASLEAAYAEAEKNNLHVCVVTAEPVAGEGNPGVPLSDEFYYALRKLTKKHHSMLLVDSIQVRAITLDSLLSIITCLALLFLLPPTHS